MNAGRACRREASSALLTPLSTAGMRPCKPQGSRVRPTGNRRRNAMAHAQCSRSSQLVQELAMTYAAALEPPHSPVVNPSVQRPRTV